MIRADQLEEAIIYRNRLAEIKTFKDGLIGGNWRGQIFCTFGGYSTALSMGCFFDEFCKLILAEEQMIRNTLEMLCVELSEGA